MPDTSQSHEINGGHFVTAARWFYESRVKYVPDTYRKYSGALLYHFHDVTAAGVDISLGIIFTLAT